MTSQNIQSKTNINAILLVICLSSSLVPFMGSALNLALPYINDDFSIKASLSGWIPTSYMLSTAIFQIPCAKLADMIGRRTVFIWGLILFILFSVLSGLAFSVESLIIYRFLSGIGSAMIFGTSAAILMSAIPLEKRGQALGINAATVYFSLAAGPFLGGILTQYWGWQSIFYVSSFIAFLVLIGAFFAIKEDWKEDKKQKFDTMGSILYALGLSAVIYGFASLPHASGFILLVVGILIMLFFAAYEKKQINPVFNIRVFLENKVFKYSSISALINYSATFAISFMLSLYLQYVRGLSPQDAGLILIVQSLMMAVFSYTSGKLSDKMSPSFLATLGMFVISVGLIGLCFIGETTSFYFIIGLLVLIGFGFGIFSSPNMNILMSSVDKQYYGFASATSGTMRLVGQSLSMGIAMMAISVQIGNIKFSSDVHTELMYSMRITFIICSVLCLFGVYASSVAKAK
ncbi:EmrB/QacA subfamily drug resistance transporter [Dysgonomonas alginatilytica]|uniref:EmrB/QacA subfamily drug resistance transporter n=1 Tax=Dysgonomonas alginatilytica TaxID=1605892 RepID=A0A2V3PSX2_9BACT|nr:MFS transporter [Dysgonomonas alginatilytica]PXV68800.1 EmrB/QacA subfamily drug resistance transporter [Dysgonomonas alginatilytica]